MGYGLRPSQAAVAPLFSAVWRGRIGRFTVSVRNGDRQKAVWGRLSLASKIRFPERGEGARPETRFEKSIANSNRGRLTCAVTKD